MTVSSHYSNTFIHTLLYFILCFFKLFLLVFVCTNTQNTKHVKRELSTFARFVRSAAEQFCILACYYSTPSAARPHTNKQKKRKKTDIFRCNRRDFRAFIAIYNTCTSVQRAQPPPRTEKCKHKMIDCCVRFGRCVVFARYGIDKLYAACAQSHTINIYSHNNKTNTKNPLANQFRLLCLHSNDKKSIYT